MAMARGAQRAYWLEGEEPCPHCLQLYTFAVERRCAGCDGPLCPHCVTVVRETREVLCPSCSLDDGEE